MKTTPVANPIPTMGKNKHKKKYIDEYFLRKHYEQKCEQLEHDLNAANNEIESLLNAILERDKMIKLLNDNLNHYTGLRISDINI